TTAAQSDYGENLHVLLDFLRVKSNYGRYAWRIRPLVLVHEVLCRRGADAAAARWQENLGAFTRRLADELLEELARLERETGIRLRTVRDHLEERFLTPLELDRLCALVPPAVREAAEGGGAAGPAFARLEERIAPLAANPTGVGLDVPHWL